MIFYIPACEIFESDDNLFLQELAITKYKIRRDDLKLRQKDEYHQFRYL